ncbi:carboxypeptidase-like regulatory domain-containing protein [Tenacibaculum ovolyticum]|uniref:carboxypeptidase-like regulatory domain-containing protein n=1 Tax=Tenacibaculum ovolyticum TaxID=104270 RepID=UPI003BAC3DD4
MKKLLFLFLYLTTLIAISQNNTKIVTGHIFLDSLAIEDVHIINKKLDIGAVSNKDGSFEILASKGDILIISHLNFEYKEHIITNDDLKSTNVNIHLNSKNYMLDEIVLKKKRSIFDVDKDILLHNAPIVNAKTLNLPYANSKKPKKEGTLKLESGVSVSISGLINAFNGKTKQKKILRKIKIEDKNLLQIRKHFTDGFFVYQLKIKKENINSFLEHCISKGIINLYHKNKLLELTTVLLDNSKNSPYLINRDNTRVTQK